MNKAVITQKARRDERDLRSKSAVERLVLREKLLHDIQWHCEAYLTGADREFLGDVNTNVPNGEIDSVLEDLCARKAIDLREGKYYPTVESA